LHENVKCCVLAAGQGLRFFVALGRTSGRTHSSIQEILAVFFLGIKRQECSAEAKNALSGNSYYHFLQFGLTAAAQRSQLHHFAASRCTGVLA